VTIRRRRPAVCPPCHRHPLIPGEEYRYCSDCEAVFKFVEKAIEAHPATRRSAVGRYTKAVVLFDDGESQEIEPDPEFVGLA